MTHHGQHHRIGKYFLIKWNSIAEIINSSDRQHYERRNHDNRNERSRDRR